MTWKWTIQGGVFIEFSDKPSEAIRSMLKANGFRWSPASRQWWRRRVTGAADFLAALDDRLTPRPKFDGKCWSCGEPGKFRNRGAAAPVLCNDCDRKDRERQVNHAATS